MLEIGALCNDAQLSQNSFDYEIIGDPTEGALQRAASQAGFDPGKLASEYPRIGEIPFLSENLYMATLHSSKDNHWIYVKGAPEKIISMCSSILTSHGPVLLEQTHQERINEAIREMTQKAAASDRGRLYSSRSSH